MPRIRRLEVQGFRGIRHPASLIFDGKSLLLFGENGTGKSSFVDALERLLLGRVSTLDGRAGLSSERHGPHIRAQDFPTKIALTFDDKDATSYSLETSSTLQPEQIREYLSCARENVYLLRRRQLLEFVDSQPRERYELLRPFLSIPVVEAWEQSLRGAADQLTQGARAAAAAVAGGLDRLRRALVAPLAATPSEEDVLATINAHIRNLGDEPLRTLDEVPEAVSRIDIRLLQRSDLAAYTALYVARQGLADLLDLIARLGANDLEVALTNLDNAQRLHPGPFFESVLTDGSRWMREGELQTCPLCEQSVDREHVLSRAHQRLVEMTQVLTYRSEVDIRIQNLRDTIATLRDVVRRVKEAAERSTADMSGLLARLTGVTEAIDGLQRVIAEPRTLTAAALRRAISPFRPDGVLVQSLNPALTSLDRDLPATAGRLEAEKAMTERRRLSDLYEAWAQYSEARRAAATAAVRSERATLLRDLAEAARKEEVQRLFDDLSAEVNDIYSKLHEGEPLGRVRLEVREAVQRSVTVKADFYERTAEDPRAFYSDAHLDTLGMAIFLTLRRWYYRQNPACDLLVLDDVMTSIDSAHAVRLAELLLTDFAKFQMLVTTHDRIWYEHLRDIQARCGVAQSFVNKVIHKWTIDEGPDLREPEDERRLIDHYIGEGSANEIAVTAGRLLEHILQELRYALRLSIEAKRGEIYEIGDLWPAFYAEIRRNYQTLYSQGRKTFDALNVRWPLRNWVGAHWNDWARSFSRATAIEFATAVRDMFDLVFCQRCRRFVSPSAAPLGQLSCRCGDVIYPAAGKQPVPPTTREDLVRSTRGSLSRASLDTARFFRLRQVERQNDT